MRAVAKTLLIDRPAGTMTVFINGDATQRVPIKRTRTLKHLGAIFKKLGFTVIDKKGRKEKQPVASPKETAQNLFNALTRLDAAPDTALHHHTVAALIHRGFINLDHSITEFGRDFLRTYNQPATLDQTANTAATVYTAIAEAKPDISPVDALRIIRAKSLDAVKAICRQKAPEAIPHLETITLVDTTLNGNKS